jgi:hypothetical protein
MAAGWMQASKRQSVDSGFLNGDRHSGTKRGDPHVRLAAGAPRCDSRYHRIRMLIELLSGVTGRARRAPTMSGKIILKGIDLCGAGGAIRRWRHRLDPLLEDWARARRRFEGKLCMPERARKARPYHEREDYSQSDRFVRCWHCECR